MNVWRREQTRRALIWVALPVIVYTVVALGMTWPLVKHLNSHAAGVSYGDSTELIRHTWWIREALWHGENPFRQTLLIYPRVFTSWVQWSQPLQYFPPALLALVFSPTAAFNLALLIVLILNGTAAYWLGMQLGGRHPAAALVGGLVFMAFPAAQGHLAVGHLGILTLYPLPLFALCLWRVLVGGAGWRTAAWGGIWFALTALAYVSQIVFVLFPLVLFWGLYSLLWDRARLFPAGVPRHRQPWLKGIVMLVVGGLLLIPFFAPLLSGAGRAELRGVTETGRVTFSTDLLGFASPSPFGPLEDAGLVPGYAWDVLGTNAAEGSAYLGLIALALAVLALRRRGARVWGLIALGAMLFSLGPLLKWRDRPVIFRVEDLESYVTLPWALLQQLPGFDATRTPGRFNLATGLAISALVSIGAGVLVEKRRRAVQIGLAAVLGAVILLEYQLFWPFPAEDLRQPEYFRQLARVKDVRAVLNVPVENLLVAKIGLFQQTIHHKPLIAGHLMRRTPQDPAVLALLDRATTGIEDDLPIAVEDVPVLLAAARVDRVIVHKLALPDSGDVTGRLKSALGPQEYRDALYEVFAVPRAETPPPGFTLALTNGDEGWSAPVTIGAFEGMFLGDAGAWYFYAAEEQYGELVFRTLPYNIPRRIGAWLDDHLITAWWAGEGEKRLPLWIEPGFHTLRFEALDGCDPYPFTLTCLAGDCAPVETPACISVAFGSPEWVASHTALTPLDVRLDYGLRLWAYDLRLDEAARAVTLRLFWDAGGPLPGGYALFVHVADPATGEPLAQYDGFPLIPTDDWSKSWWVSEVQIGLPGDLPAGNYVVNVGWFKPETNERIAVRGDRPWAGAGIVYLETVTVP
jgi:hypothetical protein